MALSCCDLSLVLLYSCLKNHRTRLNDDIFHWRAAFAAEHEPRHMDASQDIAQVAYEEVGLEDTAHASGVTLEFTGVNCGLAELCGSLSAAC